MHALAPWMTAPDAGSDLPSDLETLKAIVDVVGTAIAAVAVVVGGVWAYYRFVRGRTFKNRLDVGTKSCWRSLEGAHYLVISVTVKNLGGSHARMRQYGSGLRVSTLDREVLGASGSPTWSSQGVRSVLEAHQWIEPGEGIAEDHLWSLGKGPVLVEVRLVVERKLRKNLEVRSRSIVFPDEGTVDHGREAA